MFLCFLPGSLLKFGFSVRLSKAGPDTRLDGEDPKENPSLWEWTLASTQAISHHWPSVFISEVPRAGTVLTASYSDNPVDHNPGRKGEDHGDLHARGHRHGNHHGQREGNSGQGDGHGQPRQKDLPCACFRYINSILVSLWIGKRHFTFLV